MVLTTVIPSLIWFGIGMNTFEQHRRVGMTHFARGVGHRADDSGLWADHCRQLFDCNTSENTDEQFALKSVLQARLAQYRMSQLGFAADGQSAPHISLVVDC